MPVDMPSWFTPSMAILRALTTIVPALPDEMVLEDIAPARLMVIPPDLTSTVPALPEE
jgi:hypothetical protein